MTIITASIDPAGRLVVSVQESAGRATFIEPNGPADAQQLWQAFAADHARPYPLPRGHFVFRRARAMRRPKLAPPVCLA